MTMRIEPKRKCKICKKNDAEAKQINLPEGFVVEYYFCKVCNENIPGYTPRIIEVYRLGQ